MELSSFENASPTKRFVTQMSIEIKETECVRQTSQENFAAPPQMSVYKNLKITRHTVAPSEYQAAYDKSSYPRSVFYKDFATKTDTGNQQTAVEPEVTAEKKKNKALSLLKRIFTKTPKSATVTINDDKGGEDQNSSEAQNSSEVEKEPSNTAYIDVILDKSFIANNLKEFRSNSKEVEEKNRQNAHCLNAKDYAKFKVPNAVADKIFLLGEKGSGFRARGGEVQDFYQLRDECLSNGSLFEDPDFPPDDSSLFFSRRADRRYEWLRPGEIVDNPQLFVEGYSRFDVQQGELGDCWLLAAVANLTLYRRLFFQIVPDDQGFDEKYAGIFHFRFWQYGRWIDVVIDDRLPTYRGQLVYLHSTEENEFWSALLEKAYAKLHGSYEALKGGSTCEAMEDFTGGVTEMYEMNATPPNLFKIILKAYERGSLMGCSLEPDPDVLEAETPEGLIRGHAYSITRVKYVDIQTPNTIGKIPLLRLRNPWGNESEWNGPWSDQSPEWRYIPEHEKQNLGLTFDNDGEFWMSFKDFEQQFQRLEICNLTPDSLTEEELSEGHKKQWEMSVFEGEWVRGVTAGGCRNFLDTFWNNPQYRITLTEVDEGDDEGKCTVIIALMQKNRRSRKLMGVEFLTIGFAVYYLPSPDRVPKPLDLNFFKYNASVARSPSFINLREVSCRFKLPPGTYCIIPSTFDPNEEGEFLLRVFSENKNNMEYGYEYHSEHDDDSHNRYGQDSSNNYNYNPSGGYGHYNSGGYNQYNSNPYSNYNQGGYYPYRQQVQGNYAQQPQYSNPNYPRQNYVPNYVPPPLPSHLSYGQPPPQPPARANPNCPYPTNPPYPTQPQPPPRSSSYGFKY